MDEQNNTNNENGYTPQQGEQSQNEQPYGQQYYGQQPYGQEPYGQPPYNNQFNNKPEKKNGLGITSMILGIVGLVLGCCGCYYLSIPLGIASIILGIISMRKKETTRGFAIAGIITGSIGIVLTLIIVIMIVYMKSNGTYENIMSNYFSSMGMDPSKYSDLYK